MDAVSDDRAEAERHRHPGRLTLLQRGRPAEHRRVRGEHADGDRVELRRAARAESADARVDQPARAVSTRVLLARDGWPHRRCERGMEGACVIRELRHALRLAHRGREGHERKDRQIPDQAGPARALATLSLYRRTAEADRTPADTTRPSSTRRESN